MSPFLGGLFATFGIIILMFALLGHFWVGIFAVLAIMALLCFIFWKIGPGVL